MDKNTRKLYNNCNEDAADHLRKAVAFAERECWCAAGYELDLAYKAVGARNPSGGFEFYVGDHPLQNEMDGSGNSLLDVLLAARYENQVR